MAQGSQSSGDEQTRASRYSSKRRRFLLSVGTAGAAGLSGCIGGGGNGGNGGDGGNGGSSGNGGNGGNESDGDTNTTENEENETETSIGEADEDAINVTFWTPFSGPDGETMAKMVETFNEENSEVQIQGQIVPWDEYYTKLYTSMTGGEAPDLAVSHAVRLERFTDVARPLDDDIDFSNYVDSVSSMTEIDGNHIALPLDTHPLINYYNKDILEEAGLDPEDPPEDPESFEEACNTIVEETDYWAYGPNGDNVLLRTYFHLLRQRGGQLLTDDLEPAFNNEDGLAIAEYLNNAFHEWDWTPTESEVETDAWNRGEVAFRSEGTWHYNQVLENDFDWGVAKPFHAPDMEQGYARAGSHTIMLPQIQERSDERTQATLTAARSLTQDLSIMWGAEAGHLPASSSVLESDELQDSEVWNKSLYKFNEMAQDDQLAFYPSTTRTGEWTEAIYQHLIDMRLGNVTPQEALDNAEQAVSQVRFD